MTFVIRERPAGDRELRQAAYDGSVFLLPATRESRALVDLADAEIRESLGDDPRTIHERVGDEELFGRIGALRKSLYCSTNAHEFVAATAASAGFPRAEAAIDPARLRLIAHGAGDNPRAAPVYYPHRDTWYGHPMSVVTMWIPLNDLEEHETFVFYPERFRVAVPNDSEVFDYDEWVSRGPSLKIGWQDRDASLRARYPTVLGQGDYGPARGFSCARGEVLLFSAAHFHRTLPQSRGRSRFSLDARLVHLADDRAGLGAPNADSRSRGSALRDYVMPETATARVDA